MHVREDPLEGKSVAIIGHTGFVGGTLYDSMPQAACFNSKNIEEIAGRTFDVVICSGLPAAKWMINQNPDADLANMQKLQRALEGISKCEHFVLLSTIDVYDASVPGQTEEPTSLASHPYGSHRHQMEGWAAKKSSFASKCTILRLPGLFGVGLKKNIIYDMLNERLLDTVCASHVFQWYDMSNLYDDLVGALRDREPGVYNLFPEPVSTAEVVQAAFPEYWAQVSQNVTDKPNVYCAQTKHSPTGWTADKETVLGQIKAFVSLQRKIQGGGGARLAVSNLAWPPEHDDHALRLLVKYGIRNVEVAPTRYGAWDDEGVAGRISAAAKVHGLDVCSLQAVYFNKDCGVFDDDDGAAFEAHFADVLKLAKSTGARKIVFGSPRNRKLQGKYADEASAMALAAVVFGRIARVAEGLDAGIVVCFEPNSAKYGCDFVTKASHALDLVRRVNHPQLKINLDTGNARMEDEYVSDIVKGNEGDIGHIQVSMPFLEPLQVEPAEAVRLRAMLPDRIFSLEMKQVAAGMMPKLLSKFYEFA
jgi:sugar phosphate isomerase/epimerase